MTIQDNFPKIEPNNLEFNDPPILEWLLVSDAINLLWVDNPKLHDLGNVAESIKKHGFQELPKFDINLTSVSGTKGAIKAGNGRIEALHWMEHNKEPLPRGVSIVKNTGQWAMAILRGTDASSEAMAEAYAIDSNNLTMSGGDFISIDYMRMWDEDKYLKMLERLGNKKINPVTVDENDLSFLLQWRDMNPLDYTGVIEKDEEIPEHTYVLELHAPDAKIYEKAIIEVRKIVEEHPEWALIIHL